MTDSGTMHVIFGTGPAAAYAGKALVIAGNEVRFVNRSGHWHDLLPAEADLIAANATDTEDVLSAAEGAGVIYNCLNVPYQHWEEYLPKFQSNLISAAEALGARYIALENLYAYGPVDGPMTEDLPLKATSRKGRLRAEMTRELMQAHEDRRVPVAIGRASDFYGPGVVNSFLGERTFRPLVQGKAAELIGDPDQKHSYAYVEDVGRGLAILGTHPNADGGTWHLPHAPAVTTRDMVHHAFELIDQEPRIRRMGRMMLMLGGLFIPEARHSIELLYEFEQPFLVDDSRFREAFHQMPTPIPTGIERTVRWYRREYKG